MSFASSAFQCNPSCLFLIRLQLKEALVEPLHILITFSQTFERKRETVPPNCPRSSVLEAGSPHSYCILITSHCRCPTPCNSLLPQLRIIPRGVATAAMFSRASGTFPGLALKAVRAGLGGSPRNAALTIWLIQLPLTILWRISFMKH